MNENNLRAAIELCYAGVTDPAALEALAVQICSDIDADAGDIVTEFTLCGGIVTYGSHGFDPGFLAAYDEEYLGQNPWFENLARQSRDRFHTDETEPPEFWESRYFHEWVRPQGFRSGVGAALEVGHGHHTWAGFCRAADAPAFGRKEVDYLTRLLPHLRRALALKRTLAEADAETSRFASIVDGLASPIVLLDDRGKARYANPAADEFLSRCAALRLTRTGRLIAVSGRADASLGAAIRKAATACDTPDTPPPAPVVIRCGEGDAIAIPPFPVNGSIPGLAEDRFVAVTFRPVSACTEIDVRSFAKAHHLTGTEARLSAAIARGESLKEFAERQGIAVATARWHLKNLEQKTGTSRIEQLVSAIHSAQFPVK